MSRAQGNITTAELPADVMSHREREFVEDPEFGESDPLNRDIHGDPTHLQSG